MSNDLHLITDFMENAFHRRFVLELRNLPDRVFADREIRRVLRTVATEECGRELEPLLGRKVTEPEKAFIGKWIDAFLKSYIEKYLRP